MLRTRVIPTLLLQDGGLVKGRRFNRHRYVGDPINAVKIFNEKEVDELVFLDISATLNRRGPDFDLLSDIASEAFMPFGYGGGICSLEQASRLISMGIEKVIINSAAFLDPALITEISQFAGAQSVVVSMDVRKSILGKYEVYINNAKTSTNMHPVDYAKKAEALGAGELLVCSVNQEGTSNGYDMHLLDSVSKAVDIPVVGAGGAGCLQHLADARNQTQISGLSAGSMFVFHGKHNAVLITYPDYRVLENLFT